MSAPCAIAAVLMTGTAGVGNWARRISAPEGAAIVHATRVFVERCARRPSRPPQRGRDAGSCGTDRQIGHAGLLDPRGEGENPLRIATFREKVHGAKCRTGARGGACRGSALQ